MDIRANFMPQRYAKIFVEPSMTKQSFRDECDINQIIDRYKATGLLTDPLNPSNRRPMYGNFSEIPTYQEALDYIAMATDEFMSLPSNIRKRFDNDPGQYLAFIEDEANREEAIALGLVEKTVPVQVPVPDEPKPVPFVE